MQAVNPPLQAARIDGQACRSSGTSHFPAFAPPDVSGVDDFESVVLTFDYILHPDQGGPAGPRRAGTLLYRNAFANQEAGYAAALGFMAVFISAVLCSFHFPFILSLIVCF